MIEIRTLDGVEARRHLASLAAVLRDCVEGGASVNFMAPFTQEAAEAFFESCVRGVERGERVLLAAFDGEDLVGTVQIVPATQPNQPHRADIAKLLVKQQARGRGAAKRLMRQVEEESRRMGRTLLTLDTVTGDAAEQLYLQLGWTKAGVIPNYALYPDGRPCATTIFWKYLREPGGSAE